MDLRDKAREDIRAIIEDLSSSEALEEGSDEQKVADLNNSFMDTDRLEELGCRRLRRSGRLGGTADGVGD
jgi:predicted metalloendopeptidase